MSRQLIAITGGIGSGKSVVCRILDVMGYNVYDCDSRARAIMDSDTDIKLRLVAEIDPRTVDATGAINRPLLSRIAFGDAHMLNTLNSIVHAAVRADIDRWTRRQSGTLPLFVETAILYQSGLDQMVDSVWRVVAPEQLRVQRVCMRNNMHPDQVRARIHSQAAEADGWHPCVSDIINDDAHSLLLQIHDLLRGAS